MTNEVKRKILALWLPECEQCRGRGLWTPPPTKALKSCPRCDGIGYTLDDATLETWPGDWFEDAGEGRGLVACIPDFTDPRDAVTLAHRMGVTVRFERDCVIVEGQSIREPFSTLGEALLSALEEPRLTKAEEQSVRERIYREIGEHEDA